MLPIWAEVASMDDLTLTDLVSRLDQLEQQNQALRRWLIVASTVALLVIAGQVLAAKVADAQTARVISAQFFEVVDTNGERLGGFGRTTDGDLML